jgi:NodT family efflux transporter outer membrane factor (OMF) lipoprotein
MTALLAGCTTPPPQALKAGDVPQAFDGPSAAGAAEPGADWWSGFGDAELTELLDEAQANNRDLAVASARLEEARAGVPIARSALWPQVQGQFGLTKAGCSGEGCNQYGDSHAYNLGLAVTYDLDLRGLTSAKVRSARAQAAAQAQSRRWAALSVAANTADQYFTVLALRQRLAIARQDIDAINGLMDVVTLRVKAGTASHLDLAREQAQLESVEAQLPDLEAAERTAQIRLAILLGRPPEGFTVKAQSLDGLTVPQVNPGVPSSLLRRRPDLLMAEASIAAAHGQVDAARAAFLPDVSLTASGGGVSAALGGLLKGANAGYGVGLGLAQSLFTGGNLSGQKQLATATQSEAVAAYQGAVLNALADVETALDAVAHTGEAQDHLDREIAAAREAFEITQLQYRNGATDLLNVLQAQQTLFSAEDQQVQILQSRCEAAVALYHALGGGWDMPPA